MKNLILFITFLLLVNVSYSQSTKTLVKSLKLETNKVLFDISGGKKINYWDDNHIKIIFVAKINLSEDMLNQLIKLGRYDLESKIENDITIVRFVKILKDLIIKGEKVSENFDFEIYLPRESRVVGSIDVQ